MAKKPPEKKHKSIMQKAGDVIHDAVDAITGDGHEEQAENAATQRGVGAGSSELSKADEQKLDEIFGEESRKKTVPYDPSDIEDHPKFGKFK